MTQAAKHDLPLAIVRPSLVSAVAAEPYPGYSGARACALTAVGMGVLLQTPGPLLARLGIGLSALLPRTGRCASRRSTPCARHTPRHSVAAYCMGEAGLKARRPGMRPRPRQQATLRAPSAQLPRTCWGCTMTSQRRRQSVVPPSGTLCRVRRAPCAAEICDQEMPPHMPALLWLHCTTRQRTVRHRRWPLLAHTLSHRHPLCPSRQATRWHMPPSRQQPRPPAPRRAPTSARAVGARRQPQRLLAQRPAACGAPQPRWAGL